MNDTPMCRPRQMVLLWHGESVWSRENRFSGTISPRAGKTVETAMLVNVPRLVTAYYTEVPDPVVPGERIAFGTSGHCGSAFEMAFNEWRILSLHHTIRHMTAGSNTIAQLAVRRNLPSPHGSKPRETSFCFLVKTSYITGE